MEDDLVAITIGGSPANLSGYLELRAHTPIKVWNNQHKGAGNLLIPNGEEPNLKYYKRWLAASPPGTMWVEGKSSSGFLSGESGLRLWYTPSDDYPWYPGAAQYNPDLVSVTIVGVDMDMLGLVDEEEESVGGYIALGGEKQLTLWRVQPPGVPPAGVPLDSGHPMTLKVEYAGRGSGLIEIWDYSEWPPEKLSLPKTYDTTAFLLDDLYIKGTSASSMLRGITLIWEYCIGGRTVQDRIKCTVYAVADVQWETYPDNIVEDPDHGANLAVDDNPNGGGGKRIYPGKKVYEDTDDEAEMRKKVRVVATIQPAVENRTVYFKWWDVDDPSTSSTIDENGADGGDNKGSCGGLGLSGGLLKTESQTDAEGEARVTFTVSMCPGDNFKIATSCAEPRIDEMTQEQADDLAPLPDSVVMSPMLTVWRKLNIEQDSMAAVPTTGDQKNYITGTADSYTLNGTGVFTTIDLGVCIPEEWNDGTNHFQNGRYVAATFSYPVFSSTDHVFEHDEVVVAGDPLGDGAPMNYKLYDDDTATLPSYLTLGATMEAKFESAYIKVDYLPAQYRDTTTFYLNFDSTSAYYHQGDWDDSRDVPSQANFWTTLLAAGFQCEKWGDGDPPEDITPGVTAVGSSDCLIYVETAQECGAGVDKAAAHEIGHAGAGMGHCATGTCIMDSHMTGTNFCDNCIAEFREDSNW